jgi:WD40 repeat protein
MDATSLLIFCGLRFAAAGTLAAGLAGPAVAIAQEEYTIHPVEHEIVWAVAIAPDGQMFAATQGAHVLIYKTVNGKLVRTIVSKSLGTSRDGSPHSVEDLDFSPNGKLLAGCRPDGMICLWNTSSDEKPALLQTNSKHRGTTCARFSADGTLLASGGHDRPILIWDVKQQKVRATLFGHEDYVHCVAFSPDDKLLASGAEDGTVRLWDVSSGKETRALDVDKAAVLCVCFSPDGKTLISGDQKNKIRIWDVKSGVERGVLVGHTSTVERVRILAGNRVALSLGLDATLRAWDLQRQVQVGSVATDERGYSESMAVSPDQKFILCGALYGAIRLIKVERLVGNPNSR